MVLLFIVLLALKLASLDDYDKVVATPMFPVSEEMSEFAETLCESDTDISICKQTSTSSESSDTISFYFILLTIEDHRTRVKGSISKR